MPAVRRIRLCAPPKADRSVKFNFKLMLRALRHTALRFWVELPYRRPQVRRRLVPAAGDRRMLCDVSLSRIGASSSQPPARCRTT